MTVGYTAEVATCRGLGNFHKLLARWKGSIYKVLWAELLVYLICYYALNIFYRQYLNHHCEKKNIKMVEPMDVYAVAGYSSHNGFRNSGWFILMSTPGKVRFPTMKHLVEAGFMHDNERTIIEEMDTKTNHPKYWVPIVWAGSIARRARKEGKIRDDISLNNVISCLNEFRRKSQEMLNYDWVNMPLVYTQVVTLAVYIYFMAGIVGKQLTILEFSPDLPVDFYFPFFGFFEFFFYFGWLKVAETLINPYGVDDEDFEVNWIIDRDFQVAYVIVDEMHQEHPNLLKDQYWDEVFPVELPYTEAAAKYKTNEGLTGSTKYHDVPVEKQEFVKTVETVEESKSDDDKLGRLSHRSLHNRSQDSLHNAIRTINSTTRARRHSRFESARKGSWVGDEEAGSVTSLKGKGRRYSMHNAKSQFSVKDSERSHLSLPDKKERSQAKIKSGGYWTETGTSKGKAKVNVQTLMEKDDVPYDPSQENVPVAEDKDADDESEKGPPTKPKPSL